MIEAKKRTFWLDLARSIAIICVIICHATEGIYSLNVDYMSTISLQSKVFAFTSFTIGRLGVPIFLFLSGYLLLDRKYDNEQCKKFWMTKFLPLLVTIEIWIVIYNVFLIYRGSEISAIELILQMLFLKNVNMSHMWYMPMILGMYVFIPFVANALQSLDVKKLYVPAAIVFAYGLGVPALSTLLQATGRSGVSAILSLGFSGGVYGLYIVLGYIVKKGCFKTLKTWTVGLVCGLSFIAVVAMQLVCYAKGLKYNVWYTNGLLMICGLFLFELLSRMADIRSQRLISVVAGLSKLSFAIYLIHNPIRMTLAKYVKATELMLPLKVAVLAFATFALSLFFAVVISKIPKVRKWLLYIT